MLEPDALCVVCLDGFAKDEKVVVNECQRGHVLHTRCAEMIAEKAETLCPACDGVSSD